MPSASSTESPLRQSLARWRELSEAEFSAITAEDWPALARAQTAKVQLRAKMENLPLPVGSASDPCIHQPATLSGFCQELIAELVAMEQRNLELLNTKLESARRQRSQLESSTRTLKNLRGSYGRRAEGCWQSYS
jgi:hypothetical protein